MLLFRMLITKVYACFSIKNIAETLSTNIGLYNFFYIRLSLAGGNSGKGLSYLSFLPVTEATLLITWLIVVF